MIKAILFDMDGTLVDSEKYYTEGTFAWVNKYENVSMKDVCAIIGTSMDETYRILSKLTGLDYSKVVDENTKYFEAHKINYNDYLFDDVVDVLNILKEKGYKLGLCSLSDGWMVKQFISDCHLEGYFDIVLSNDEIKEAKPNPEIYLKALELLNINNKEALVIEDSYNGILAGKNANIITYARNADRYHIDQSKAEYIFSDMHDILNKINKE